MRDGSHCRCAFAARSRLFAVEHRILDLRRCATAHPRGAALTPKPFLATIAGLCLPAFANLRFFAVVTSFNPIAADSGGAHRACDQDRTEYALDSGHWVFAGGRLARI